jgi:hypothetical protein
VAGESVAKSVAMYRKRALTVETGARREVRCRGPAAETRSTADMGAAEMGAATAETRPTANMSAAEARSATADMRRSAHMHTAAEVAAAAHRMRSAATAEMRATAAAAVTSTSAASSRTCISGARESGHEGNSGESLESRDFGF